MEEEKKTRFSCFTKEQQDAFDTLPVRQQKYLLFKAQGMSRGKAYELAGYRPSNNSGANAAKMEKVMKVNHQELVMALSGQTAKMNYLKENTEQSKKVDKKAEKLSEVEVAMFTPVPRDSAVVENKEVNVDDFSVEQCRNISFFRRIANGTIKSVKITTTYDKDGNITGKKVEETSDVETRIKAQKEVMRIIGVADVIDIGKVEANNINIMIVDASKKDIPPNKEDIIDTKDFEVKEVKEQA